MARLITFLLLLLAPLPASAQPGLLQAKAPDIDAFMQIGAASAPALAADGSVLFFTSSSSGVSQVYRLDRDVNWPYQLTAFTEGVDFYTLSPTGDYLICGVGSGGNENSQLWLLDARTGQGEALTDKPEVRYGSPTWSKDGDVVFYASNQENGKDFKIYRMELASRKESLAVDGTGWNSPNRVSDDGRSLLYTHAESNVATDVYLEDLRRNRRTLLTPHEGEALFVGARFDATGHKVYLLSDANPDGILRRAVVDLATRELTFLDTEGVWETESMALSPDGTVMAWSVNEDGYSVLKLQDLVRNVPLPAPPVDGVVRGFDLSNSREVAFSFTSPTRTDDVWIWSWEEPALAKATYSSYAGTDPGQFVSPRLIHYTSFDGREIPAFLYVPPGWKPGHPMPFVVHVHGGPESQFRPTFIRHFQYLLLNGFGILAPNVRGSAGYGREYRDLDNYRNRLDSVKDLKAGADYLIAEGYSAPGLLAVKGGSYGGYMTLAAITEYPTLFSAAVDEVGIANFVTFLQNTADYRRYLREAEYGPLSDPEFLESISPIHKANLIETPLLVAHGRNDPRVPVGEAEQIAAAIEARGGTVDLLIFEDEGHGVSKRANILTLYRQIVEFLSENLTGHETP